MADLELDVRSRYFVTEEGRVLCCSCVGVAQDGRAYLVVCVPEGRPPREQWLDEEFRHSCDKQQYVVPLSVEVVLALVNAVHGFLRKEGPDAVSMLGCLGQHV